VVYACPERLLGSSSEHGLLQYVLVMPCGVTVGSLEPVGGVTPVTGPFTGGTTGLFGLLAVGGVTPPGLLAGFGPTPGTLEPGAVIVVGQRLAWRSRVDSPLQRSS
jgi:hypothetical protein